MIDKQLEADILRLHNAEAWKVGTIASQLGVHHSVVRRVLCQAGLTPVKGEARKSMVDDYLDFILEKLEKYPTLPASRLYQMVRQRGYRGRPDHFRHIVARHRPRPKHEAFLRLRTLIGEQAQADWGYFGTLTIGRATRKLWAFVMVLSWSRQVFLRFYLSAAMPSFVRGHVDAFAFFGGVPRVVLYDNLKSAVLERAAHAIHFNPRLLELARHYSYEPRPVAVAKGNQKGRVERAIRYIRTSFFPALDFSGIDELNQQALEWMTLVAGDRRSREDSRRTVSEDFAEERTRLLPLPIQPFPDDEVVSVEVGKTPYVRFDLNDYSVPHPYVRRSLAVVASLDEVRVLDGAQVVATHARVWDRGVQIEDPAHIRPLVELKRKARENSGMDRLHAAAPSAMRLLEMAAESGANLGSLTARLLKVLAEAGPSDLETAIATAVERGLPTVGAVRQLVDQQLAERGLPPPVPVRIPGDHRAASVTVRNHQLSSYDNLKDNDHDKNTE